MATAEDRTLGVRRIEPAYKQVADQLRALVLRGELHPGERLPNETDLSTMFGVSRSTLREALRVLSSQNLITTSRGVGGGSFVARPAPQHISECLETSLGLLSAGAGADAISIADLLETRELLEVPAARLAAKRRSAPQLQLLRSCLANAQETVKADEPHYEGHWEFHDLIMDASGNRLLAIVTRPISSVVRNRFRRDVAPKRFWGDIINAHERILRCIEKGDGEGAAREMLAHLEHLRDTYERIDRAAREPAQ